MSDSSVAGNRCCDLTGVQLVAMAIAGEKSWQSYEVGFKRYLIQIIDLFL